MIHASKYSASVFGAAVGALIIFGGGCSSPGVDAGAGGGPAPSNFILISPGEPLAAIVAKAARVTPSPAQWTWQKREVIAFAHFGMDTFTDREWGDGKEDPALFNPTAFDARQWVRVLKAAGMKMLIITAKHHDGFCLWPSRYTGHSVRRSPWRGGRGDVVAEVAAACTEEGLDLGVYLSPWDRHEPSYGDSPRYNEHFRNQLRELLTQYGPIAEVWFDGARGEGPNGKRQEYDWASYYAVIREHQPQAVIAIMGPDVRWVGTESGYGRETEWSVVPANISDVSAVAASEPHPLDRVFAPIDLTKDDLGGRDRIKEARALMWYPAETDVSIRPGWFYHPDQDDKVKTAEKLVDIYYASVGRNGVLLLNVPPDRRGLIHDNDAKALTGMRRILDATFARNFASGARVRASSSRRENPASAVLDEDGETFWTTAEGVEAAEIEFDLAVEAEFGLAIVQENIRVGQRVEDFVLEAWDGSAWTPFARGTTIGHKRLLRFPSVTAKRVRLVIRQSRMSPTLSALGLYGAPKD